MTGKTAANKRTPKEEAANRISRRMNDILDVGWDDDEDEYDRMAPAEKKRYKERERQVYEATEKVLAPILERLEKIRAPHKNEED